MALWPLLLLSGVMSQGDDIMSQGDDIMSQGDDIMSNF